MLPKYHGESEPRAFMGNVEPKPLLNLAGERARLDADLATLREFSPSLADAAARASGAVLLAFAEEMLRLHYMVPIPHLLRPSCGRCGMAWPCEERERIVACARECGIEVPE